MSSPLKKNIVQKTTSGDTAFDAAVSKFIPLKKIKAPVNSNKAKLRELEKSTGVPFNEGKTPVRIQLNTANIAQRLLELPEFEQQSHRI